LRRHWPRRLGRSPAIPLPSSRRGDACAGDGQVAPGAGRGAGGLASARPPPASANGLRVAARRHLVAAGAPGRRPFSSPASWRAPYASPPRRRRR
jgi:hypothetical protein